MSKQFSTSTLVLSVVVALLLAGFFVKTFYPTQVSSDVDKKTIESLNEQLSQTSLQILALQKNPTVVEKNVTVSTDTNALLLTNAKDEFLKTLDDNDNLLVCGDNQYSVNNFAFKKDAKIVSVNTDALNRHDTVTTIDFTAYGKLSDNTDNHPCYQDYNVEVKFHSKPSVDTETNVTIA